MTAERLRKTDPPTLTGLRNMYTRTSLLKDDIVEQESCAIAKITA